MKSKLTLVTVLGVVLVLVAACAPAAAPAAPTAAPAAAQPTAAPAVAQPTAAAVAVQPTTAVAATQPPAPTTAPAATSAPAAAAGAGGVLRLAQNASDLGNLDPHFATSTQDRTVVDMVFNGLVRYKPGDGSAFEADLATALPQPETAGGKQVWTFQLRKGVMCHASEGVPAYELTSDDVVYSLKKAANKDTSAYAGEYTGWTVEAPDANTVKITLDQAISPILFYPKVANYSGGFIVCRKAAEKLGADGLKTHPVGTGPFMFKSYTPQDRVVLAANDAYWRGKPKLDGVEVRYMGDLNSRELGFRSGELDVINGAPDKAWVDKMAGVENSKVDVFGVGEEAFINFNMNIKPIDKLEVRQAIAYALNRDEFLALIGEKIAENVYSPVPAQFLPGGLTKEEVDAKDLEYKYDPEKAKKLLADAGLKDGFSMDLVTSEMTGYKVLYESMQNQLSKVGIKINLKVIDHSSYHSTIRQDSNALVLYIAWRPNADAYLTRFFHSDSIVVSGKKPDTNFSHYNKIDDLIMQARNELDAQKQIQLWKDAQVKILQDMVAYPIQYQNQVYARKTGVDYGHELKSVLALYPGIDETTSMTK